MLSFLWEPGGGGIISCMNNMIVFSSQIYVYIFITGLCMDAAAPDVNHGRKHGDDQPMRSAISEMRAAVGFHSQVSEEFDFGLRDDFTIQEEYKDYRFPLATSIVTSSWQFFEQVEYNIIASESDRDVENTILALKNNEAQKIPVRLTRKHKDVDKSVGIVYTYDGLYHVVKSCPKEGTSNRLTYRLNRLENQMITINQDRFLLGHPFEKFDIVARILCKDISAEDPERIPIIVTNEVDDAVFESSSASGHDMYLYAGCGGVSTGLCMYLDGSGFQRRSLPESTLLVCVGKSN